MNGAHILASLPAGSLGRPLRVYTCVGSTNDLARDWAGASAPEGATVLADEQTAGRGRQGRSWSSPAGHGLYLSVILRPPWPADDAPHLALLAGEAVAEALRQGRPTLPLMVKWPNDVLCGGRKICGILVETGLRGARLDYAVIGIGLNVRQTDSDWPPALSGLATSCAEQGLDWTVEDAAVHVLRALTGRYRSAVEHRDASASAEPSL